MWHAWERIYMLYMFWSLHLKGRANLKDVGVEGKIILKYMFNEMESCGVD
jgi:hypothetical protein